MIGSENRRTINRIQPRLPKAIAFSTALILASLAFIYVIILQIQLTSESDIPGDIDENERSTKSRELGAPVPVSGFIDGRDLMIPRPFSTNLLTLFLDPGRYAYAYAADAGFPESTIKLEALNGSVLSRDGWISIPYSSHGYGGFSKVENYFGGAMRLNTTGTGYFLLLSEAPTENVTTEGKISWVLGSDITFRVPSQFTSSISGYERLKLIAEYFQETISVTALDENLRTLSKASMSSGAELEVPSGRSFMVYIVMKARPGTSFVLLISKEELTPISHSIALLILIGLPIVIVTLSVLLTRTLRPLRSTTGGRQVMSKRRRKDSGRADRKKH